MLSFACSLWDAGYSLYTYSSIFIIILIVWQVKRSYHGLRLKPKRSCCRRHRKVRQRARDAASRDRRISQEEAEKPWKLLSIMKSQSWLPPEGSIRQLLCPDACCQICNIAALEIRQLVETRSNQMIPSLLGLPQGFSCLEIMSMSSESLEQNSKAHSRHSREHSLKSITTTQTQRTEQLAQMTNAVSTQEYCNDLLELEPRLQLEDLPLVSEMMSSSRLMEPVILVNEEETMQSNPNFAQENQDYHHLKSSESLLPLGPEITDLTHTMALQVDSDLPSHLLLLSPQALRHLEVHVKKWMHFQKWGLPRRVEQSLRQLMPDPTLLCRSRRNQQFSSILKSASEATINEITTISHEARNPCLAGQPTRTCWVSEWSVIQLEQGDHWHQIQNYKTLALTSQEVEPLNGFYPLPEGPANGSENSGNLQKKYNQLFCGLPSLHSESLVTTLFGSPGLPNNNNVCKTTLKEPHLLKELSLLPSLPKTPATLAPPSSPISLYGDSLHEHQGTQISVPFLTGAECEALECHLLQRQLQFQWGLPAVVLRTQYAQSHMQYEPCDKAQHPKSMTNSWLRKPFSLLNKQLFFPEHARRLLEFHLQKQLIHLRWGLPEKIQQSIQLFLSSTEQQHLSWGNRSLLNVRILQSAGLEADRTGDLFSPIVSKVPMPHLFAQAKAILQSHINSKCEQIHQGKVPAHVCSSWECRIPAALTVAPLSNIQDQPLELQAASDLDLHQEVPSPTPVTLNQEQQAFPGAVIEHCRRPHALSEETIKKLETTLRHQYLAFLSGLPVIHCVTLSRATSPATASQSKVITKVPQEPLGQTIPLEQACEILELTIKEDNKASADTAGESQTEGQGEGMTGQVLPDSQASPAGPYLFNTQILSKLNFHLKKKILAIQLGIPALARGFKDPNAASQNNNFKQESVENLNNQKSIVPQKQSITPESPPALDVKWVHLKKQLATELKNVYHNQKQPGSNPAVHDSAQWISKSSPISRDLTQAQVLCVQVETGGNDHIVEEFLGPEPQVLGKSKYSALVPTLTEKREEPEKPKAAGDLGEGDAGLGLSSANEKRYPAASQKPEGVLLNRAPQGSWQQRPTLHLDARPHSPQHPPHLEFPEPSPPGVPGGKAHERDMQDSPTKPKLILKAVKIPEHAQPAVPRAQGKPLQAQALQDRVLQRPGRSATPHKSPSPPESNLRNKMKSFLHSINPKVKGKIHGESTISTAEKATKTRKENVEKSLAPAKRSMEKTKPESRRRALKTQSVPSEKSAGPPLSGRASPDSTLGLRARQHGSASVPSLPRHCPRHCPRLAHATQVRNPP